MTTEIKNAIIESVFLGDEGPGFLTATLFLDYGGIGQAFGHHSLYLPKSFKHHNCMSVAGHFIWRCMEIGEVSRWSDLKGKTVRVKTLNELIQGIGHIVKNDWFIPAIEFDETLPIFQQPLF